MDGLKGLEPEQVFHYFNVLNKYPRGAGNEKAASDYVVSFAEERGFKAYQDEYYNVIVKKPGTIGYENAETLILQAHLDMVNIADSGVDHDFTKEPIDMIVEGDFVTALGTTLGADNGIGVAMILALLDSDYPHPPLEAVFTTGEELGLVGAKALDISMLKGRKLLSMDAYVEGDFIASSAGGMSHTLMLPIDYKTPGKDSVCFHIEIKHLSGGHSGADIHRGHANACKLMGRLLHAISDGAKINVGDINIGIKNNVIPKEGFCTIVTERANVQMISNVVKEMEALFQLEFAMTDSDLEVTWEEVEPPAKVFSRKTTKKLIQGLIVIPSGVHSMHPFFENVVESSNNFAIVRVVNDKINLVNATRYSSMPKVGFIELNMAVLAELLGAEYIKTTRSPYWEFKPNSPFREQCLRCYKEATGKEGRINALHGGLECGIFYMKNADLDLVSTGMNIFNAHTTQEKVSISSVQNVWRFILRLAEDMKR